MTLTIFKELEQGSDEWLEARRGILTASVVGKLITPSTLKTADNDTSRGVVLTLAAERITGHVDYVHPTFDMQRGTDDEPVARAVYAEHYAPVEEVGFIRLDADDYTLGFSPDGLVGDDGLIEIKSRRPQGQLIAFLSDKVPTANMAQLQAGMLITGRKWIDYVSFSAGLPLYVKRVYPDPDWQNAIITAARDFETNIVDTIRRYETRSHGQPATERRPELEEIRI